MKLVNNWEEQNQPAERPRTVLTIGSFDGLHLGHRYLIDQVIINAKKLKSQALVLTFEPHPLEILAKAAAPPILTTLDQKAEVLEAWGVDILGVLRFDKRMAGLEPWKFLKIMIDRLLKPTGVVLGPDFTFGRDAEGSLDTIKAWSNGHRARFWKAEPQKGPDGSYSSSQIRQALKDGLVESAARDLGRPYRISGTVVHGLARGRDLGYPTANLGRIRQLVPGPGVYAAWALVAEKRHPAMISIGYNPTFGEQSMTVEAHILDFDAFLYGQTLSLEFAAYLRPMIRFESVDKLVAQLQQDRDKTSETLQIKIEA